MDIGMIREKKRPVKPNENNGSHPASSATPANGSVMGKYNISNRNMEDIVNGKKEEENSEVKRHARYMKILIERFRSPNTFKQIRRINSPNEDERKSTPPIVAFCDKYTDIMNIIDNCFSSNVNTYILLTGSEGNGRSSAVYYAVNSLLEREKKRKETSKAAGPSSIISDKTNTSAVSEYRKLLKNSEKHPPSTLQQDTSLDIKLIEADAFIYNNENKILHFITNELTAHDGFEGSREQNAYMKLTDYMKNFRIVVYIKNIEVFADEPRQVFLYSLLDNINTYSIKVCVVFSTNCLFFLNRLEKRVKSRFSYKNFIFEDFDLETHLVPILEARFYIQEYERVWHDCGACEEREGNPLPIEVPPAGHEHWVVHRLFKTVQDCSSNQLTISRRVGLGEERITSSASCRRRRRCCCSKEGCRNTE